MNKVRDLYESLADGRCETWYDAIPFREFADLIKTQVSTFGEKNCDEVAFRVVLKDEKIAFTARARREAEEPKGWQMGAAGVLRPAPTGGAGQVVLWF